MSDLEMQQYLFDVQGYLVIEGVLSAEELAELNELIDARRLPPPEEAHRFGSAAGREPEGPGFLGWGRPFCDLLDHPRVMPILRFRLGDCFRLDRLYGLQMSAGMGWGPLHADYGAFAIHAGSRPGEYHPFRDNQVLNGFAVAAWNLAAAGPDHGGFCCIPGSHKTNFRLPRRVFDAPDQAPCVVIPEAPAGSVILFTEALTHGTAGWTGAHQRRSLLYKYCVSHMAWSSRRVRPPETVELTPRQKVLFSEPGDPHRFFPSLFAGFESEAVS